MSEMSGAGTVEWSENAALLEKRANSAEKQVTSSQCTNDVPGPDIINKNPAGFTRQIL